MRYTIKVLGPSSEQCEMLVNRIEEVTQALGKEVDLQRIEDLEAIISFHPIKVPTAIVDGEKTISWTMDTTSEQMMNDLLQDSVQRTVACRCGGGCKKKKENPSFSCHH